jgi:propionyl-CoA carboxylase alpha chain
MFYDPMIAKLITSGATRKEAIDRQIEALDAFRIEGIGHNVDFLSALMQHPRFRAGALTTGFIAEDNPEGFHGAPADEDLLAALAAIAAGMSFSEAARAHLVSDQLGDPVPPPCDWTVRIDGREFPVTLGEGHAVVDGKRIEGGLDWEPGDWLATATAYDAAIKIIVAKRRSGWLLTTRGARHQVTVYPAHIAALSRHMLEKVPPDLSRYLICPMPGLLTRLDVGEGDRVEAGQPLAVVEAMKMENILRAEKAGKVKAVNALPGDSLAVDAVIMEFE